MNKLVINHLDKIIVTSDASTIVSELEVEHPAAKLLALAARAQEQEIGDSTNLVGHQNIETLANYSHSPTFAVEILGQLKAITPSAIINWHNYLFDTVMILQPMYSKDSSSLLSWPYNCIWMQLQKLSFYLQQNIHKLTCSHFAAGLGVWRRASVQCRGLAEQWTAHHRSCRWLS